MNTEKQEKLKRLRKLAKAMKEGKTGVNREGKTVLLSDDPTAVPIPKRD